MEPLVPNFLHSITFKQLKNELPKLDGDPAQSKEDKEDKLVG